MRAIVFFAVVGLFAFFAYEAPGAVPSPSEVQDGIVAAQGDTIQAPAADGWLAGAGEGVEGDEGDEGEVIVEETEETAPEVVENEETEVPVAGEIEAEEPYVAPTLPEAALVLENEEGAPEEQPAPPEEEQSIVEQLINASEPQPQPQP